MTLNTYIKYFEKWKITTTNYQFISVVNLKLKRKYTFQGDDSNELLEIWDEYDYRTFIDYFYKRELELSMDHENYELTPDDIEYMLNNKVYF